MRDYIKVASMDSGMMGGDVPILEVTKGAAVELVEPVVEPTPVLQQMPMPMLRTDVRGKHVTRKEEETYPYMRPGGVIICFPATPMALVSERGRVV